MARFYFPRVPKFKIRSGGVVGENEDISPQPLVLRTTSVPDVAVPQASKTIVGTSTTVPLALGIVVDIRRLGKRKTVVDDEGETSMLRGSTEDDGEAENFLKTKRGRDALSWRVGEHASCSRSADPAILEKLQHPSTTVVASIHKYFTSVWERATEGVDLSELIKMAEMNTARSHVLNCELYKVLMMKVDKMRSTVVGVEDINALRLENQALRSELAASEDANARAVYDITKSGTI
ncbi:hypothetical protein Fot_03829 [Forsythia ovata]|uniref:Uncharacterized protein n=1 Tax=Forsythia ovata TaxID=205694 RepID=A0ABD1XBP7_9LAMI